MRKLILVLGVLLLLISPPALAWDARVVSIADGDTITVLAPGNRQVKIRLYGIDCPERRQPFGSRAREATGSAVAGKTVNIKTMDKDRYGRTVALVEAPSIGSLQEFLLDSGLAWVYPKYCGDYCSEWSGREAGARTARRGLWKDKNPVPPWMWRKR